MSPRPRPPGARARPPRTSTAPPPSPAACSRLLAEGRNNAGIGGALGLTDSAVEKHINSIFSKLGLAEEPDVHRRVRAALIWLSGGSRAGR